jgi:hypothetical protein
VGVLAAVSVPPHSAIGALRHPERKRSNRARFARCQTGGSTELDGARVALRHGRMFAEIQLREQLEARAE